MASSCPRSPVQSLIHCVLHDLLIINLKKWIKQQNFPMIKLVMVARLLANCDELDKHMED